MGEPPGARAGGVPPIFPCAPGVGFPRSFGESGLGTARSGLPVGPGETGGLPRSLNLLARAAWINAATQGVQKISAAHVQCAMEMVPCVPGLHLAPAAADAQP